jgi:hypothetical protein
MPKDKIEKKAKLKKEYKSKLIAIKRMKAKINKITK